MRAPARASQWDQLVAGREHRHPWAAMDQHPGRPRATSAPTWRAVMCVPAGGPGRRLGVVASGLSTSPALTGSGCRPRRQPRPGGGVRVLDRTTASARVQRRTRQEAHRCPIRHGRRRDVACRTSPVTRSITGAFAEALATSACARRSRPSPSRPRRQGVTSVESSASTRPRASSTGTARRAAASPLEHRSRAPPAEQVAVAPGARRGWPPARPSRLAPARRRGWPRRGIAVLAQRPRPLVIGRKFARDWAGVGSVGLRLREAVGWARSSRCTASA